MAFFSRSSRLFKRLLRGDESALERLFEIHSGEVFEAILKFTKSERTSKAILKEVFHYIWENRDAFKSYKSFRACLDDVIMDQVFDHLVKVASDKKLQKEVWNNIQAWKLTKYEKPVIIDKQREFVSSSIQTESLGHQLLAKLSTMEG